MKNIFKIIRADLRHIKTNVIALCVIIGLTVIPALYSWFNILSNWDPMDRLPQAGLKLPLYLLTKVLLLKERSLMSVTP